MHASDQITSGSVLALVVGLIVFIVIAVLIMRMKDN